MGLKNCRLCGRDKPLSDFYKRSDKGTYRTECKQCLNQRDKSWREKNKSTPKVLPDNGYCYMCHKTKSIEFFGLRQNTVKGYNSRCLECDAKYQRAKRYGLTQDELEELLSPGRCEICGGEEELIIDHCHNTGEVRGILCSECNHGLGKFKDSQTLLRNAVDYLNQRR